MISSSIDKPRYLGHRKRIKDRFLKSGLLSFQDYEVLELLLTYAVSRKDVKPLAKDLIDNFKTFNAILDAPITELKAIRGIGDHFAILLKLVKSCSDFYLQNKLIYNNIISNPQEVLNYCKSALAGLENEHFMVIYLNSHNEVIGDEILHEGTVDQAAVYPRKILEHALKRKAVALICVHNHPSGNCEPSSHDKSLTQMLIEVTKNIGIHIHDHLIVGKQGYFSFREEGLL
jgi:DNA repair protein RadC